MTHQSVVRRSCGQKPQCLTTIRRALFPSLKLFSCEYPGAATSPINLGLENLCNTQFHTSGFGMDVEAKVIIECRCIPRTFNPGATSNRGKCKATQNLHIGVSRVILHDHSLMVSTVAEIYRKPPCLCFHPAALVKESKSYLHSGALQNRRTHSFSWYKLRDRTSRYRDMISMDLMKLEVRRRGRRKEKEKVGGVCANSLEK